MFRRDDFKRRTPDVYTRRNGKLEKLNENKPYGELIQRMDCVISRLNTIIEGLEDIIFDKNGDELFDEDDLMTSEELDKAIERIKNEQSDSDTEVDSLPDEDYIDEIIKENHLCDSVGALDLYTTMKLFFNKIYSNDMTREEEKEKKTIFCILGESGSGKDTLVDYTINAFNLPLKSVLSYTDRPIRPGEQQGKEHIFLSKDKMTAFLDSYKKDIAAYTKIGETGYRYCATTTTIDKSDIYIIDPNGLKEFKERTTDRYNIVAIYIDCPLEERRKRTQKRGDESIRFESRVAAECEQFSKFREEHGYDHIIDNGSHSTMHKSAMALFDIFRHYRKDLR